MTSASASRSRADAAQAADFSGRRCSIEDAGRACNSCASKISMTATLNVYSRSVGARASSEAGFPLMARVARLPAQLPGRESFECQGWFRSGTVALLGSGVRGASEEINGSSASLVCLRSRKARLRRATSACRNRCSAAWLSARGRSKGAQVGSCDG